MSGLNKAIVTDEWIANISNGDKGITEEWVTEINEHRGEKFYYKNIDFFSKLWYYLVVRS